ncbi:MAG: hypothetical protein ACPGOV_00995 [Magnetovibrionaceae bacterium]
MIQTTLIRPEDWLDGAEVTGPEGDCIIAVMLKILDGKCKMAADEKLIMTALYDAYRPRCGEQLGETYHRMIAETRDLVADEKAEDVRMRVYEHRVLAETMISRPVMKGFKARLRRESLLAQKTST